MTLDQALKAIKFTKKQWKIFLRTAKNNYCMQMSGWAYVGGMKDALWVMSSGDRILYNTLEVDLNKFIDFGSKVFND